MKSSKTTWGFSKVFLQPGEERNLQLSITEKDLQFFYPDINGWGTDKGNYEVLVGNSSRSAQIAYPSFANIQFQITSLQVAQVNVGFLLSSFMTCQVYVRIPLLSAQV